MGWPADTRLVGTPAMDLKSYIYTRRQQKATTPNTQWARGKQRQHHARHFSRYYAGFAQHLAWHCFRYHAVPKPPRTIRVGLLAPWCVVEIAFFYFFFKSDISLFWKFVVRCPFSDQTSFYDVRFQIRMSLWDVRSEIGCLLEMSDLRSNIL